MNNRETMKPHGSEPRFYYGYVVVLVAFLIMLVLWGVYYAFGVFFKPMLSEFGWSRAMTSGAYSLGQITTGVLVTVMGGLNDRVGPRVVMSVCGVFLGIGYLMISQIHSLWQLYLSYGVIIGTGMSGGFIPVISTVARWFVGRRGIMTGFVAAGVGAGALIGPPVANLLISNYGWRISYLILGVIVLAVIVLSAQLLKSDPTEVGQIPYPDNRGEPEASYPEDDGVSLHEALFNGKFWAFYGTGFSYGFCLFSIMVHISPHAIDMGISGASAANILAIIGASSIVGKVFMGRVADMIGSRLVLMVGFALMSAALIGLIPARMVWVLYSAAGVFGFGYGSVAVSHSPLVADLFGLRTHGLIFGAFGTSVQLGGAVGPFMTGYIFDTSGGYSPAFAVGAVVAFFAIVLASVLKRKGMRVSV
jgi:MFS family permease